MSTYARILLVLTTLAVSRGVSAQSQAADLTGTWHSEGQIPYLVESTETHPQGVPVEHEQLEILSRSATLQWELTELPNGLVKGTNHWIAYGEGGVQAFDGFEGLLGAVDGDHVILSEPEDEANATGRLVFDLYRDGNDRLHGIGYSATPPKLVAMRVVLVRDR